MRMIYSGAAVAVLAALALAGCSSTPDIAVKSSGTMPPGGTYALVESAPANLGRSVSDTLVRHGLTESTSPDYIVQVSYAERPAGTGLLVPEHEEPQWLRRPDFHHKKRPIVTLGVSISELAGGRELYRASASGRPHSKGDTLATFLHAILPAPASGGE